MFNQISALDTTHTAWKIKARLTRMWPSLATSDRSLKGYNLILLDDDNCHVHAYVYAENWREHASAMEEGSIYIIFNFYTKEATGTLRPTSSKIIINFSNSTTVEKLSVDDFMIPNHKFEFTDLGDLFRIVSSYENEQSPELATDLIGVLEDFEKVKDIKTQYGDRKIVKFRITDGRYSHLVTIWGQPAVKADEEYSEIADRPIIVIITSVKMKVFRSSVQISTLPSSKVYLNLDDEVVHAMKIRLEEEGYKAPENPLTPSIQSTPPAIIEKITVAELADKTNTDDLKRRFNCLVKISSVENNGKWWYYSCNDCRNEVLKLEGRFKCVHCPKSIPIAEKRYKIVVLAGDSTEAFNFLLMDRCAKRLIGCTATKLMNDNIDLESSGEYPAKIMALVGREVTFQIEINSDNVLLQSKIFEVVDAYDRDSVSPSASTSTYPGGGSSLYAESIRDLSKCFSTPESASSISKKPKMEN